MKSEGRKGGYKPEVFNETPAIKEWPIAALPIWWPQPHTAMDGLKRT